MNIVLPTRMTVDEFLAWAVRQDKGRYELFRGRVVMQQPQSWGMRNALAHANVLARRHRACRRFLLRSATGMTVRIRKHEAYEPDALVAPLP